jgi:hypothetical protein
VKTCPVCGEPIEEPFTDCWKCARADEDALRRAPAEPGPRSNADWPDVFGLPPDPPTSS